MPTIGAVRNKAGNTYIYISGCSSVWLERVVWDHEAAGSSPVARTIISGCSSVWLERYLGVVEAEGSSPFIQTIDTHSKSILLKNNCWFESNSKLLNSLDGEIGLRACLINKYKMSFRCV